MATRARRGRGRPPKNPVAAAAAAAGAVAETPAVAEAGVGEYEREREARIRENMERMQKLGIIDLAQTLNQCAGSLAPARRGRVRHKPALPAPSRRSLR